MYPAVSSTCALLIAALLFFVQSAAAADRILAQKLENLVERAESRAGSLLLAVQVSELSERGAEPVFAHNSARKMKPASVVKIVTTLAALRTLGAGYRFPTEVFVDSLPQEQDPRLNPTAGLESRTKAAAWRAGSLYVRGYGDPSMVDERLWRLARSVRRRGITEIDDLVIDNTLFVNPPGPTGDRPYQAGLSAAALNHNCYAVHLAPSGPGLPGFVSLTPGAPYGLSNRLTTRKGSRVSAIVNQSATSSGFVAEQVFKKADSFLLAAAEEIRVDVKGTIGVNAGPQTEYLTVPYPPSFYGGVLRHFLEGEGVRVLGRTLLGETPRAAKKLLVFESRDLSEILKDLNYYSNNFIAGQLQYAMGQDKETGYFRLEKGLERISSVLLGLGFREDSFDLYDASGLDKRSRLTAEQLVAVLAEGYRDFSIAPDLISSFSRYGHTGTLKKREALSRRGESAALRSELAELKQRAAGVWGKTGTLSSVSTLAGYLQLESGRRAAFAVLISGIDKDSAVRIEDSIVELLIGSRAAA